MQIPLCCCTKTELLFIYKTAAQNISKVNRLFLSTAKKLNTYTQFTYSEHVCTKLLLFSTFTKFYFATQPTKCNYRYCSLYSTRATFKVNFIKISIRCITEHENYLKLHPLRAWAALLRFNVVLFIQYYTHLQITIALFIHYLPGTAFSCPCFRVQLPTNFFCYH
jgi:hypothetical protein